MSDICSFLPMDEAGVRAWFDQYLGALAACGRGESDDPHALLDYCAVPLLVATDEAARALTTADDVVGFARQQIAGMRAANYDHTETIDSELTVLKYDQRSPRGPLRTPASGRERDRAIPGQLSDHQRTGRSPNLRGGDSRTLTANCDRQSGRVLARRRTCRLQRAW